MSARDELLTFAARLDRMAEQAAEQSNEPLAQDYRNRAALLRSQAALRRAGSVTRDPQRIVA